MGRITVLVAVWIVALSVLPTDAQSASGLGLAKSVAVSAERDGSFRLTYSLRAANGGPSEIRSLEVEDDLGLVFAGTPFEVVSLESPTAQVRSDYDGRHVISLLTGGVLEPRQSVEITLVVRVVLDGVKATFSNSAIARGVDSAGNAVSDQSQDGAEPDPDWDGNPLNNDAPTIVNLVAVPKIGAAKDLVSFSEAATGEYVVTYSIIIENFGQLPLYSVNVQDNLALAFPSPAEVRVSRAESLDFTIDPEFDGMSRLRLLAGTDGLDPGERGAVSLTLDVMPHDAGAWFSNQAVAFATSPDGLLVTDASNEGTDADPDADGDPTDDNQATPTFLAQSSMTGFAETTVRVAALPLDIDITSMLFSATLRVDDYSARVDAKLTNTLFDLLTFSATGPFGDLFASSLLALNPSTLSFVSWQTTLSVDILGASLTDTVYLTSPQASSYSLTRLSATLESFALDASARFGLCPLAFWDATLCADWDWGVCETPLSVCVSFDDTQGFVNFQLAANDIPLLETVLGPGLTLDVLVTYEADEKAITPTLQYDPDWILCPEISLLGDAVLTPAPGVSAIRIYGATVEVAIGDVIFRAADSFSDDMNATVTGESAYFESFSVEKVLESCCGSPGRLEGAVYFERSPAPSGGLFGVGLLEGFAEFQMSSHLLASFTVEFRPTEPHWTFTARLRASW
jgi:hypothetical protein